MSKEAIFLLWQAWCVELDRAAQRIEAKDYTRAWSHIERAIEIRATVAPSTPPAQGGAE